MLKIFLSLIKSTINSQEDSKMYRNSFWTSSMRLNFSVQKSKVYGKENVQRLRNQLSKTKNTVRSKMRNLLNWMSIFLMQNNVLLKELRIPWNKF